MTTPVLATDAPATYGFIDDNLMSPDSTGNGEVQVWETTDQRMLVTGPDLLRMARWLDEAGLMDGNGPDDNGAVCAVIRSAAVPGFNPALYDATDAFGGWEWAQENRR